MSKIDDPLIIHTNNTHTASVIWLHGLGANGHDFEPIVPELQLPASAAVRFIFPDAPFRPVTINGGYMMRAWYDISGEISEASEQDEEGVLESAGIISLLLEQQIEQGIDSRRIVLAGFSQGGAIALYAGLQSRHPLAGIMALSGYLPLANHFSSTQGLSETVPSIFMAHGNSDPVVPIGLGEASRQQLRDLGLSVDWYTYPMEHNVCAEEIMAIREWLIERLT